MMEQGRIVKALSGFYYVETAEAALVDCKARGRFRKDGKTPTVGDRVEISRSGSRGMIETLLPRENFFVRPAVCNLDLLVVFCANVIPVTDPFLIDRVTAIAGNQNVPVVLCINKTDREEQDRLGPIYEKAGYRVVRTSAVTGAGIDALREAVRGRTAAFTGNSGVGKSSVLNRLAPELELKVGEVSDKLGRGRHTTRHVELYALGDGTFLADTPGFSSFDTERMDLVLKENLQYAFPDFAPYLGRCQFHDCAHLREPGCAVRAAVEAGAVPESRYRSYERLYERARELRTWELK